MFSFIQNITANLFPRAVIAAAPAYVLRDELSDQHVSAFWDHNDQAEHDLWAADYAAEKAQIQHEWDTMSEAERSAIWDDYCDLNIRGVMGDVRYYTQWSRNFMVGYVGD
jgi:hypothetical protein